MCLRPIKHKGNSLTVIYNQVYDKINASFNYLMLLPPPPLFFLYVLKFIPRFLQIVGNLYQCVLEKEIHVSEKSFYFKLNH